MAFVKDRPIRLLLVDDDDWDCAALHMAVEQTGVPVEWRAVHSAEEAEQWRGGGYVPDLIVIDNGLPGMQGDEFAGIVLSDPLWCSPEGLRPLVVRYTGQDDPKGDAVIRKPPSAEMVRTILLAAQLLSVIAMMAVAGGV